MELICIPDSELPESVVKVCGTQAAGPAKMMAAKGLAPMGARDLITALYQLSRDADAAIAEAAESSANKLPDNILAAALKDPLHPFVLHFFAGKVINRPGSAMLIEVVLLNRVTADDTFLSMAEKLSDREVEIVAANQERLLRCPAIIEALYFNRNARMSTISRLLEMAVRQGLTLSNIPHFDELSANILGTAAAAPATVSVAEPTDAEVAADQAFAGTLAEGWEEGGVAQIEKKEAGNPRNAQDIAKMPVNAKIRLATIGNSSHRAVLIKDAIRPVYMAAIGSPAVSEQEATKYAADRSLSEDIIREIARRKDWQKSYQIKVNLANNPKTPLAISMRLLTQLRQSEVRAIARSKSVSSQLATAARKMSTH